MESISCVRHKNYQLGFIYLGQEKTQVVCSYCLSDNIIKDESLNLNKLVHISKILKQPEAILQKIEIDPQFNDFFDDFFKNDQYSVNEQISNLEKQMKSIQDQILQLTQELAICINKIHQFKQNFINNVLKQLKFEQLKQILLEFRTADNINSFDQIQNKFHQMLKNIIQNISLDFKSNLCNQIVQLQNNADLQISDVKQKFEQIKSQFNNELEIQFKFLNSIQPKFQLETQKNKEPLMLNSNLVDQNYQLKLIKYIQTQTKKEVVGSNMIYMEQLEGLNHQVFWQKITGKSNLLMIFKSKSNYIWGAFSPCTWQRIPGVNYYQDSTNSSFLFSVTHDEFYPIQEETNRFAICCDCNAGPVFGQAYDIVILANFQDGFSILGRSYKWDKYQNQKSTHLYGSLAPNIIECHVFEIIFK